MNIDATGNRITNLVAPVNANDATNRSYCDALKPTVITYVGDGATTRTIDFGRTYSFGILYRDNYGTVYADCMNYNTDYFFGLFTPTHGVYGITPSETSINIMSLKNFDPVTTMSPRYNVLNETYVIVLFP